MASTAAFAATPKVWTPGLVPATLDTSLTAPTNTTTIATGGASGSKIEEIAFVGVGTTVASVVNIFIHDGTTHHLVDQVLVAAVTSSTTAVAWRQVNRYNRLLLPTTSHTLRVSNTVSGNQSMIKCTASGGDF